MNGRTTKQIRRKSLMLLIDWIKTLVSEEEAKKLTIEQAADLVPTDTHIYANGQMRLSAFSLKWINKKIKKLIKYKNINDITVEDLVNEN
jgi:hypothetical protein